MSAPGAEQARPQPLHMIRCASFDIATIPGPDGLQAVLRMRNPVDECVLGLDVETLALLAQAATQAREMVMASMGPRLEVASDADIARLS